MQRRGAEEEVQRRGAAEVQTCIMPGDAMMTIGIESSKSLIELRLRTYLNSHGLPPRACASMTIAGVPVSSPSRLITPRMLCAASARLLAGFTVLAVANIGPLFFPRVI